MFAKIKNTYTFKNYSRIYPYVHPYLFRVILALVLTLPLGAMDAVIAWVLKPYMDVVMIEKKAQAASLFPLLIIVFSFCQSALNYGATYLNSWVGNRITLDLKRDLFKKMMRLDASCFDTTTSGTMLLRFNQDADSACMGLLTNLKLFTTRLFSSISLIGVLIYNSWQLSIIAIVVLFGALYPLTRVRKRIKEIMNQTVCFGSSVMTHYNEAFAGNRIITSFNLYNYQFKRFSNTLVDVFKVGMKMVKRTGLLTPMMHFVISIGIAGVIWLGSYLIMQNQLTAGGFVSFITALLMLYHPIKSIGTNFASVQISLMAIERVFEQLDQEPRIKNIENPHPIAGLKKEIIFEDVCFAYEEDRPVLKHINLTIPKGKTIALVGNSGGGKTTLVNLIPRFYDVIQGSVKIDGVDIRHLNLDQLRQQIAIVFQDNFLFDGTIRENIILGKEDASDEEIHKAVKNACLDEFIESLPTGLDTPIGERGTKLSGGQKQRIAIARAFLKDAPIVILDEATSALDNKSEAIVQQAIYNLMADRTVFLIAHRLSTVKNADMIVVLDHGELKEKGTHENLMQDENSLYNSLYRAQLK